MKKILYNIIGIPFGLVVTTANIYNNTRNKSDEFILPMNYTKISLMIYERLLNNMFCIGKGVLYYFIWPISLPFTLRRIYKYKKENDIRWLYPTIKPADDMIENKNFRYYDWIALWKK